MFLPTDQIQSAYGPSLLQETQCWAPSIFPVSNWMHQRVYVDHSRKIELPLEKTIMTVITTISAEKKVNAVWCTLCSTNQHSSSQQTLKAKVMVSGVCSLNMVRCRVVVSSRLDHHGCISQIPTMATIAQRIPKIRMNQRL